MCSRVDFAQSCRSCAEVGGAWTSFLGSRPAVVGLMASMNLLLFIRTTYFLLVLHFLTHKKIALITPHHLLSLLGTIQLRCRFYALQRRITL